MKIPLASGWRLHLVLVLVLLLEVCIAAVCHVSDEEVTDLVHSTDPKERLTGWRLLANRGEADEEVFSATAVATLLNDPEPRLRRFALTVDVCKFRFPLLQLDQILGGATEPDAEWFIDYILQMRKTGGAPVGGGRPLSRLELEWYLDALEGISPPPEEALECLAPEMAKVRVYLERRSKGPARTGK